MERKQKSGAGFFFGLLLGVIIGASLVILFLPRGAGQSDAGADGEGFDLRKRAEERFGPWIERLRDRYADALAFGQDAYDRAREDVLTRYNSAKSGEFTTK